MLLMLMSGVWVRVGRRRGPSAGDVGEEAPVDQIAGAAAARARVSDAWGTAVRNNHLALFER